MANRLETLITVLCAPLQRIENAMIQLLTQRTLADAVGAQLDALGKIVGQGRQGNTDDVYRQYISARILVNRSTGKRQEIIAIAQAILDDNTLTIKITDDGTMAARITIVGGAITDSTAAVLAAMEIAAAPLGVRLTVQWSTVIPADTFTFDVGPGWDVGHLANALDNLGD